MLNATCPYCHTAGQITDAMRGQPLTCGNCGGVFSVWGGAAEIQPPPPRAVAPPPFVEHGYQALPPPVALPVDRPPVSAPVPDGPLTWQPSIGQRYTRRRRSVGASAVNRLMLLATGGWLLGMVVTTAWLLIENSQFAKRGGAMAGAAAADVIAGSMCLWLFESMAYGVVMIVLWVIRENVRE